MPTHRSPLRLLPLLVLLALGAGAAGPVAVRAADAAFTAPDVRAVAEVLATPITLEADPSGTALRVRAVTSIPLICSAVYGPDTGYGQVTTGMGMGGPGGMTDHDLLIGGLTPGSTLVVRVQGVGPDGTLYVGEPMTTTLPDPGPDATAGADLAAGATIRAASSAYSDAYGPERAIDGDLATEWSSRGDGDDAWIEIDLGAPQEVASVTWVTRSMTDGTATTTLVAIAADGVDLGIFPVDAPAQLEILARVLRLSVASSTGGNTGAREILIRGPAAPAPSPAADEETNG